MKKIVTFEQEKRREMIYVVFNSVFVAALVTTVSTFLLSMLTKDYISASGSVLGKNILLVVIPAIALIFPFSVYNSRSDNQITEIYSPKKISPLWYIFGIIFVAGIGISAASLSEIPIKMLENSGFIIHEANPYVSTGEENVLTAIFCSLIVSVSNEYVYRGILTKKLNKINIKAAIFLPAFISASLSGSLLKIPVFFVLGVALSWIYLKTDSVFLTTVIAFFQNLIFYGLFFFKNSNEGFTLPPLALLLIFVFGLMAFVLLVNTFTLKTKKYEPKDDEEEFMVLTNKETVFGILKSFAFWIFVFSVVFSVFFYYLSNPNIALP